ncbi:hypothetical protein D3C86_1588630 [compost metagenome]
MAVLILGVVEVFEPLLQLPELPNLHRRQLGTFGFQCIYKIGIRSQCFRGADSGCENIIHDLVIHCIPRPDRRFRAASRSILRRHTRHHHQPLMCGLGHQEIDKELR